jgi:hypothetical protein
MEDARMKKTLCVMAFSCLMAVGMAGCGGGGDDTSDIISDLCNKLDSCGYLPDMGMTLSECKSTASSESGEATSAEKDAARACLAKSSCEAFVTCVASM